MFKHLSINPAVVKSNQVALGDLDARSDSGLVAD